MIKSTGIVRRIDDLGRVVIPREVRKAYGIKEGYPLEICITEDGILLKRFSSIATMEDVAKRYTEALSQTTGYACIVVDNRKIISAYGIRTEGYNGKELSDAMDMLLDGKKTVTNNGAGVAIPLFNGDDHKYSAQCICPVISDGDVMGAIILFSDKPNVKFGAVEEMLLQSAVKLLGKEVEA